jgi:hypothetical protein
LAGVIGGGAGTFYATLVPVTYTANLSFLVEEGKSGSGGGLASLAGQFGFDLGGLGGGNGLLSGDNVMVFLKSSSLLRETIISPYDSSEQKSLADQYALVYGLQEEWKDSKGVGKEIHFPVSGKTAYTRIQDSLIQVIVKKITKENLFVEKPDKKASFVQVTTEMRDELLSRYFCERLVKKATERYIFSKISRQEINVSRLQRRADSIGALLNRKTYATAVAQEQILDINPGYKSATVVAEVSNRDKAMLATIYGEVIKNLEISKIALSQETPTIQVVDEVVMPLKLNEVSRVMAFIIGSFLAAIVTVIILSTRKLITRNKI